MPSFDAGQTGITPGVTILTAAGAVHTARAPAGIPEPVAGSGVYHFAHPAPGTLLLFVFDVGAGTVGASVWDDGLTTIPARAGDAMTLTAAYDHAKDDVLTPLEVVDGNIDAIKADYARRTGDYNAVAPLDAAATQAAAQVAIVAEPATLAADQPFYAPTTWRDLEGLATASALAEVDTVVDGIAADYAKTGEASAAATSVGLSAGSLTQIYIKAVAALNAYDPPSRSETMADRAAILGVIAHVDGIVDAILADTSTTIPAAIAATDAKVDTVDGILDTILPLIQRVYRYFFNKRAHTNSSVVVYADDGVTPDATMTVTGDATTVTKDAPA